MVATFGLVRKLVLWPVGLLVVLAARLRVELVLFPVPRVGQS
jgi:hypothetical protein